MDSIRAIILSNTRLAALLLVATLLLKVMVPAGFMVGNQNMVLTISVCGDLTGEHFTQKMPIPVKSSDREEHSQAKGECPFTSLAMNALHSADPILLAWAIAFVLAVGLAPQRAPDVQEIERLRPPLRAPPVAG